MIRAYNRPMVLVFDHYHNLPITVMIPNGFVE